MTGPPSSYPRPARAPVWYWVVGVLLVLWNCWGLLGAIAAQIELFPEMPAEVAAYFERQPLWFMIVADISPLAGVAGAIALLLQSRWAPRLFLIQIAVIFVTNGYEMIVGTSLLLTSSEVQASTALLLALLSTQFLYAHRMAKRGLLS